MKQHPTAESLCLASGPPGSPPGSTCAATSGVARAEVAKDLRASSERAPGRDAVWVLARPCPSLSPLFGFIIIEFEFCLLSGRVLRVSCITLVGRVGPDCLCPRDAEVRAQQSA